jgi:hypothetical protein
MSDNSNYSEKDEPQTTKVYTERFLLSEHDKQRQICTFFTTLLEVVQMMDVILFYNSIHLKTKERVLEEI